MKNGKWALSANIKKMGRRRYGEGWPEKVRNWKKIRLQRSQEFRMSKKSQIKERKKC